MAKGNVPAAIMLLEMGVSGNDSCILKRHKQTLYHWAVRGESKELFLALRNTRLSPNVRDDDKDSPLYLAVIFGKPWFVAALLEAGANVNKSVYHSGMRFEDYSDTYAGTDDLLAQAILHSNSLEIVELLLAAGVNINTKANVYDQGTALHVCIEEGQRDMLEAILKNGGAKVEAKDRYKRTPLHLAVLHENKATIKLLLSYGAKTDAKDADGQTPIDYATGTMKQAEILAILKG
jgi:ankyrin repeat protein